MSSSSNDSTGTRKLVGVADYGDPPKKLRGEIRSLRFHIHHFMDLKERRNESIRTPKLKAHGYSWGLQVFPRGCGQSSHETENVSIYLCPDNESTLYARATFKIKNGHSKMTLVEEFNRLGRGYSDFIKREDIHSYLEENGTLTIDVDIQLAVEPHAVWYPKIQEELFLTNLYGTFSETADVTFLVGGQEYKAHTVVLALKSSVLHDLAKEANDESYVTIPDVDKETFQALLDFIYLARQPALEDETSAKSFLFTADRFGCTNLKLFVESIIVEKFLTTSNAADLMLLADGHSCALLKEACFNMYVSDPKAVRNSQGWPHVVESNKLLDELLICYDDRKFPGNEDGDPDSMDVTSLRERLEEANLEMDGSREMLVERLKSHKEDSTPYSAAN